MPDLRSARWTLALLFALVGCASAPEIEPVPAGGPAADVVTVDVPTVDVPTGEEVVMYELYVRSFTPEGTFRAIIPRLDEIRDLGATTIWLMPIHPVGEARRKGTLGSPYAIQDYKAVNPRFGTLDDFRALVDAVHERDMTIIIDLVANHTAWDNAWVEAHPEWYTKDADGAIIHPEGTDWTDVADLDYSQPGLRDAMRDAMRFWVEDVGIDGYRCDVAELVPHEFWEDAIAELRAIKPVLMLAEGHDAGLHRAGFDLTYGWNTYHTLKQIWRGAPADTLFAVLAEDDVLPDGAERLRFTTNHDETAWDATPLDLFGGTAGAQAAAILAATIPGALLLYNGQEVGDTQRLPLFEKVDIDWDADPAMRAFYEDLLARRASGTPPVLIEGSFMPVEHSAPEDVVVFERDSGDGVSALVVVNVRNRPVSTETRYGDFELEPYGWRIEFLH